MATSLSVFQTTRNVIASMSGLSGYIEIVTAPEVKRMSDSIPIIKGDGNNTVQYIYDPAQIVTPVTFKIIIEQEKAFAAYIRQLFQQHMLNPQSAGSLMLRSYSPAHAIVDTATMPTAVITSCKAAEGDTGKHSEALVEVTVQPLTMI
ncbi:MAG TPA: hypothetical protein VI756_25855 [Blastocatellia bacterium]